MGFVCLSQLRGFCACQVNGIRHSVVCSHLAHRMLHSMLQEAPSGRFVATYFDASDPTHHRQKPG
jgi:hypothetical protein